MNIDIKVNVFLLKLIKILIFSFILLCYYRILRNKSYHFLYYNNNNYFLLEQDTYLKKYLFLKNKPSFENDSLIIEEKKNFLKYLSHEMKKNITDVDSIFYSTNMHFGNALSNLNKLIFYCEIINCKKIILDKNIFWFIQHNITIQQNNISIEVNNKYKYINNSHVLYFKSFNIFFFFFKIKPEIRINYLKFEIIRNLPKINNSKEYLFIHFRSDDIFIKKPNKWYAQPPLCFYNKILNNYDFKKIYLISKNKKNIIINKLINSYSNIIFSKNSIKEDISYLINAYNIVASISSFLISIIQLNSNLNFLFDYNIYKRLEQLRHFHYDLYKLPHNNITIFRMEPSRNYKKIMYEWKNNRKQRKIMLKEKCLNDFTLINYKLYNN